MQKKKTTGLVAFFKYAPCVRVGRLFALWRIRDSNS